MWDPGTSQCPDPSAHPDCLCVISGAEVLTGVVPVGPLLLKIHLPKGVLTWVMGGHCGMHLLCNLVPRVKPSLLK